MLLSPGHSPRQISSPSPSENPNPKNPNPNPNSTKNPTILDEDQYVASIEKIIERDFFPDIPKLRDRLDWLEAIKTRDPVRIRDAQLKIIERRRGKIEKNDKNDPNLGSFRSKTPGSTFFKTQTPFEFGQNIESNENSNDVVFDDVGEGLIGSDLSLDGFFRRYTSEDNDSFSKILEKVNRKRKERNSHLIEGENEDNESDLSLIEGGKREKNLTDGFGTSDQPISTLESWKYKAKNLLMYHPADNGEVALTDEEMGVRVKGLTKEISKTNTRFHGEVSDRPKEEDTVAVLYNSVPGATPVPMLMSDREMDKGKRYDLEDLRKTPNKFYTESSKKAENGYNFVCTPSPAPGVDESPFITWGEIEGTPLRLETEDTPIGIGGNGDRPHFKIPLPPTRDVKAHTLSREAARKIRERSKMFEKPPLHSPSRGARGGSVSPNPKTLSPAAQKFMRNAIAKSSNSIDESLRASYRSGSPGLSTPKIGRSLSRFGKDGTVDSRSPSVRDGSNPPW